MLPQHDGNFLVRTDFAVQHMWDGMCDLVDQYVEEGLLATVRIVDDIAYEGMMASRLLDVVPHESGCVYLAVADASALALADRPQECALLVMGTSSDGEDTVLRARLSELASIDANLSAGNMEFSEYMEAVNTEADRNLGSGDGPHTGNGVRVFTGADAQRQSAAHPPASRSVPHGEPLNGLAPSELLPGATLRAGKLSSPSGAVVLVNQDDGDLVIYRTEDGAVLWRSGTSLDDELAGLSNRLVLQDCGDLVLFAPTGTRLWSSGTRGRDVRSAVLRDDGRFVLLDAHGVEIWVSDLP
ncbi:DUF6924 domain-containing protein [Streptomyces olivaceus]|uniref:DUF6924 domain-containing protein n=1 Tax=Streptomyces olivaceus TaxID=47716 RepID=UPI00382CF6A5